MKKINNKGYMLVEIILAFSITFILIYFIMDLVIKTKNKNDDLMVETLVRTDQTIITNKLMSYAIDETDGFDCNSLKNNITDSTVKYGSDTIDIVSKYAKIDKSNVSCSTDLGKVSIRIPIKVEQMKDEVFDVVIDYKYDIGDNVAPECELDVDKTNVRIVATKYKDSEGGSGVAYYGFNPDKTGENETTKDITGAGTYTFYVVDKAKNESKCLVDVQGTKTTSVSEPKEIGAANENWKAGGTCSCRGASTGGGYPVVEGVCGNWKNCSCPDGTWEYSNSCTYTFSNYYCTTGSVCNSNKCCTTEDKQDIECIDSDYNKINDSFCYKIG